MKIADILEFGFQPGDLLFIKGDTFWSDGISWLTSKNGGPSHVAVYVGGGKQAQIGAVKYGVSLDTVGYMLQHAKFFAIRRIPDLTVANAEKMKDAAYGLLNKKYDRWQFVTLALYLVIRKLTKFEWVWLIKDVKGKYVCSALGYKVCLAGGFKLVTPENRITPCDMFTDTRLESRLDVSVEK